MPSDPWEAQRWAREQPCDSAGELLVLMMIAVRAGDNDGKWECHPSQKTLAEDCQMSVRSVRRHLVSLEAKSYLSREERRREDGYRTSDKLTLNVTSPARLSGDNSGDLTGQTRRPHRTNEATSPDTGGLAGVPVEVPVEEEKSADADVARLCETPDELVDAKALCDLLAGRIEAYSGKRPKIRKRWITEMDLLLRRGPTDWATPERISRGEVVSVINRIFDYPDPRPGSTFSWAKNIQSAPTLREKWEKLRTHEFTPAYQTYEDDDAWMVRTLEGPIPE